MLAKPTRRCTRGAIPKSLAAVCLMGAGVIQALSTTARPAPLASDRLYAQSLSNAEFLPLGHGVERCILPGETQHYRVKLSAGIYLRILLDHGAELIAVSLRD